MTNERIAGGAPLGADEAALLAALRARGLNELAEMALHCFGQSYGHAHIALRELLGATRLGWTTGSAGGGAGGGGLGSEGVAFASTGGIGYGGAGANPGSVASVGAGGCAEHYGPVGAEPNRCNWMRGDERCSLPYPHDGRPHQIAAWPARVLHESTGGAGGQIDSALIQAAQLLVEQRRLARLRFQALQTQARAEFAARPLVARGQHVTEPRAINPQIIEAWYREHGVEVRADIHPNDPKDVVLDPIRLVASFDPSATGGCGP